jgi:hypothetical protein
MISSKTVLQEKNLTKIFLSIISIGCKTISCITGLKTNIFEIYFLRLQNHFLENMFKTKIFEKNCWSKILYGCKIISSKTRFKTKTFLRNFFLSKIFLWLQNYFLENRFVRKNF